MNKSTHIKEKNFDIYSNNIKLCLNRMKVHLEYNNEALNDLYICPICERIFFREHLQPNQAEFLTLEHVPPKSLGGNPKILTCNNCNNLMGTKFESQLVLNQHEIHPQQGLEKEIVTTVNTFKSIGKLCVGVDEKINLFINVFEKSPLSKELGLIKENWNHLKGTATFKMSNPKTVALAKLKTAHLLMYIKFGFGYLNTYAAKSILQLFKLPDFNSIPSEEIRINPQEFGENFLPGIYLINEPIEIKGYLVYFQLKIDGNTSNHFVPIPPHNIEYQTYLNTITSLNIKKFELIDLRMENALRVKSDLFFYSELV